MLTDQGARRREMRPASPAVTGETRARGPKSRAAAVPQLLMWAASQRAARSVRQNFYATQGDSAKRRIAHLTVERR
jgi:hypothetical protein